MRKEDAAGTANVRGGGVVYESSVPGEVVVRGESGRMNYSGDRLRLVECTADAKLENTSLSTGGLPCPLRN